MLMKPIFVDTSAFYAVLVPEDPAHIACRSSLAEIQHKRRRLTSSSLVLQETTALLQSRLGIEAVRRFHETFFPLVEVVWVDQPIYTRAMESLLAASLRRVSLTDWSSFEVMRERGIEHAFAFDGHFRDQGFRVLPEES